MQMYILKRLTVMDYLTFCFLDNFIQCQILKKLAKQNGIPSIQRKIFVKNFLLFKNLFKYALCSHYIGWELFVFFGGNPGDARRGSNPRPSDSQPDGYVCKKYGITFYWTFDGDAINDISNLVLLKMEIMSLSKRLFSGPDTKNNNHKPCKCLIARWIII